MRKIWLIPVCVLLLAGCGKKQTLETVSDEYVVSTAAVMQNVIVEIPPELAVPALQDTEAGELYLCDDYSLAVQTVEAGDLAETIRDATGMERETLQIQQTRQGDAVRYQWVWSANGENGIQVGRGCILDDGKYHYVLTALADEEAAKRVQPVWQELFASFRLVPGESISSGS